MGQIDSMLTTFLKTRGLASRNADLHGESKKFEGAYVKPPMTGIHDWVVDFDFTSLYPSIIMSYNIGTNTFVMLTDDEIAYYLTYDKDSLPDKIKVIHDPTHTRREEIMSKEDFMKKVDDEKLIYTISGGFFKNHNSEESFYSVVLEDLLTKRKGYKKEMFTAEQQGDKSKKSLYDIRQLTYKVLANSLYGVLGNHVFRFFNRDMARAVTLSGQEATKTAILEADAFVELMKNGTFDVGEIKKPERLYISEVYGDMDRFTPNVITGDTDSLFVKYDELIRKVKPVDTIKFIDDACRFIEIYLDEIIKDLVDRHRISQDRNRLQLKNELVIDRGLFLAKKRYAIHIIQNEGKPVDKANFMGLEIKRSDYPSYSKEFLKEILDIIFESKKISITRLTDFVFRKKDDFMKLISEGDKSVARPCSFTRKVSEYKAIPQNVHAMLNWNDLEYQIFEPGSKGYLFKLRGIDLDKAPKDVAERYNKEFIEKGRKLDVVAIPDEEDKLPDYYIVDNREMLDFAWEKRYNLLLAPLLEMQEKGKILTW